MYSEFRKIRYALAVAQVRSFTGAAERLHVSQSAISEQIRLLEDLIGFPLFRRSSRGIELTNQGRSFLQEAERVYNDAMGLTETARQIREGGETFLIGMGSGLTQMIIRGFLTQFRKDHPLVRVDLATMPTRRIYDRLHAERLDLGVSIQSDEDKFPAGLVQIPFLETDMVLVAPEAHELGASANPINIDELADEPILMSELGVGYGEIVQGMFADAGLPLANAGIVDNVDSIKSMATEGLGPAILPRITVDETARQAELVTRSIIPETRITICLIRRQKAMSENAEAYIKAIREIVTG